MIRRLKAQRAALEHAAHRISAQPGIVLEFGLGNGRTYDHLREILSEREIYVFDRQVAAHPCCVPPDSRLYLGDLFDTLPQAVDELGGQAVLAHLDIGTGDREASQALARRAAPMIADLLASGGIVVSDQRLDDQDAFRALPLPDEIEPGRIFLYERT